MSLNHQTFFRVLALLGLFCLNAVSSNLIAETELSGNDLAIALPLASPDLLSVKTKLRAGQELFPKSWYESVSAGFDTTGVGEGFRNESPYSDWRLVSLRIVPCAPLAKAVTHAIESICWPEIRLVFQPILHKIRLHELYMEAAADDRAVHAIYPLPSSQILSAAEEQRLQGYFEKIQNYKPGSSAYSPLDSSRLSDFNQLRSKVLARLISDTRALRQESFVGVSPKLIGLRPEMQGSRAQQQVFMQGLLKFLSFYTKPSDLRALTAFSLPEGREPAHLDEWFFLAFRAQAGQLIADDIRIHSRTDGQVLASLGPSMRGSQLRDDERLYELLNGTAAAVALQASVMFYVPDIAEMSPRIQDRQQTLVPNTSCVSCHKLNALRFDFHNFSYLEDRDITISPRVIRDVELDLAWLRKNPVDTSSR